MIVTEHELGAMRTLIAYAVHSTDANICLELFDNYMNGSSHKSPADMSNAIRTQQIRKIGDVFDKLILALQSNEQIIIQ